MRTIRTLCNPGNVSTFIRVRFNSELSEYVCQLFIGGKHYEPADYFTDDRSDAFGTANHMYDQMMVDHSNA